MHILVVTDADFVRDEIVAALSGPDTSFTVCRTGRDALRLVEQRLPDLVITDLQIGAMGGMALAMQLRLDESSGRLGHVGIVMLLDRAADVHLAKRSASDAWVVKPLDALTLERTVARVMNPPVTPAPSAIDEADGADTAEQATGADEEETVGAG